MRQSRLMSLVEAVANVVVGYGGAHPNPRVPSVRDRNEPRAEPEDRHLVHCSVTCEELRAAPDVRGAPAQIASHGRPGLIRSREKKDAVSWPPHKEPASVRFLHARISGFDHRGGDAIVSCSPYGFEFWRPFRLQHFGKCHQHRVTSLGVVARLDAIADMADRQLPCHLPAGLDIVDLSEHGAKRKHHLVGLRRQPRRPSVLLTREFARQYRRQG
jgi:hypothetical protein